jgi:aminopeptidase N
MRYIGCLLFVSTLLHFHAHSNELKGCNGIGRNWWNALHYQLNVDINVQKQFIKGEVKIQYAVISKDGYNIMQLDLQTPMQIDRIKNQNGEELSFKRDGRDANVTWIFHPINSAVLGDTNIITVYFSGVPNVAANPPWDGGFIWKKDQNQKPWVSVACQGKGASAWWPCKDLQSDEPELGVLVSFTSDSKLPIISNGVFTNKGDANNIFQYKVHVPINLYNVTFYLGDYIAIYDTFNGENGVLNIEAWCLKGNELKMKEKMIEVKKMLVAFEYWFGPYPFYKDGYKIVEAPFLGMEHQSAIAYGNQYLNGYLGKDRSNTGIGLDFDFIIVHESGHEWFGNHITAHDIADNWIHEGFTTYSEALFVEYYYGKKAAYEYTMGEWRNIKNDKPIIAPYCRYASGSTDQYDKGSALVHSIRLLIDDDEKFRSLLRHINRKYGLKTVSSNEIEQEIIAFTELELQPIFNQYLRTNLIPTLDAKIIDNAVQVKFEGVVNGFKLPISWEIDGIAQTFNVSEKTIVVPLQKNGQLPILQKAFYIKVNQY